MKGNLLFSCTVFCPVWFSFIVVLSDTLTFICEETCNIVTLSILSEIFEGALSLTCVSYDLENHLPLCLQCIEQGFSHVHVLLKMQYLIQALLSNFFNQMKIKKEYKVHAALDLIKVWQEDWGTAWLSGLPWVSLWLSKLQNLSLSVWVSTLCKMQFIHVHVAHNDAIWLNWRLQSSSWPLWETCCRNSKL